MRASTSSTQFTGDSEPRDQPRTNGGRPLPAQCPFLGIEEDPATAYAFATPINRCFIEPVPDAIELHHQETYCLTAQYTICPLFQAAAKGSLAQEETETSRSPLILAADMTKSLAAKVPPDVSRVGGALAPTLFALSLIALLFFGLFFSRDGLRSLFDGGGNTSQSVTGIATATEQPFVVVAGEATSTPTQATSATATETPDPTSTPRRSQTRTSPTSTRRSVSSPTAEESAQPTSTPEVTPIESPTATATSCGPPASWVTYVVQAGDNFYRISLRYDTTVSALMAANCLNTQTVFAGQTIFVPFQAPVIIPSATAVNTVPPAPTDTPVPPAPPPTEVPPTNPPPAPTDPPPPPEPSPTPPPPATATPVPPATPTPPIPQPIVEE